MSRRKRKLNPGDPKPLNFDHDEQTGPSDRLEKSFQTSSDARGDNRDDQYYDSEEALSPEEVKKRKEEGTL